jgi:hypothetical protein
MAIDFEFMKTSYDCIKETTCDKCPIHTDQIVVSHKRSMNNDIYFCPNPEIPKAKKIGSGAWKKTKRKV